MNATWEKFCADLLDVGKILSDPIVPQDPLTQAEGVRYLSRLLRYSTINCVEYTDPRWPQFTSAPNPNMMTKIGADNPDNIYMRANISGKYSYRITGTRGGPSPPDHLRFPHQPVPHRRHHAADRRPSHPRPRGRRARSIRVHRERGEADGRHCVAADGPGEQPHLRPPDLPGPPQRDSGRVVDRMPEPGRGGGRSTDRGRAEPATRPRDRHAEGSADTFLEWSREFMPQPNEIFDRGQEQFQNAGGDPSIFYFHGYWKLADDEAWVIDTEIPNCEYYNFVLQNFWVESLDYHRANIYINNHTAKVNDDGTLTIVVAAEDPRLRELDQHRRPQRGHLGDALDQGGFAPDPDVEGREDLSTDSMKWSLAAAMIDARDLCELARVAEEVGFDSIAMPDSVFYPETVSADYPYSPDGKRMWRPRRRCRTRSSR